MVLSVPAHLLKEDKQFILFPHLLPLKMKIVIIITMEVIIKNLNYLTVEKPYLALLSLMELVNYQTPQ
jgi:hypothetical protein